MKIAVYTSVFGGKGELQSPSNLSSLESNVDFFCITDNEDLKSDLYQISIVNPEFKDVAKNARKVKICGFPGIEKYDLAVWHDISIKLDLAQFNKLIADSKAKTISVFHHNRYCLYLEAVSIVRQKKDHALRILVQVARYFLEGYPSNNRLNETGIMVTVPSEYFGSALQTVWWKEVENWSRRDQISLVYSAWKANVTINLLDGGGHLNPYSEFIGHSYGHYIDTNPLRFFNNRIIRIGVAKLLYEMRRRR